MFNTSLRIPESAGADFRDIGALLANVELAPLFAERCALKAPGDYRILHSVPECEAGSPRLRQASGSLSKLCKSFLAELLGLLAGSGLKPRTVCTPPAILSLWTWQSLNDFVAESEPLPKVLNAIGQRSSMLRACLKITCKCLVLSLQLTPLFISRSKLHKKIFVLLTPLLGLLVDLRFRLLWWLLNTSIEHQPNQQQLSHP